MKIYESELDIEEQIVAASLISCASQTEEVSEEEKDFIASLSTDVAEANIKDDDLFYHKSILVSTSWNNNDDIFLPDVVWPARYSPVHKPSNLNHNSSKIVGHITGAWAIDADKNLIDENVKIKDLPNKFHILCGSVIYKKYHNDSEYEKAVATLIKEIKEGKQYVSMECRLQNFDYAILGSDNIPKILQRNEKTAFLTKHLRAYGGKGIYENYKIGRVLRDISFIGKGYTKNPANKESVIFTSSDLFDFANAELMDNFETPTKNSVISLSKIQLNGADVMSDILQEQNKELKTQNEALAKELKELGEKLAKADVAKFESQIESLTAELESVKAGLAEKAEMLKSASNAIDATKAELDKALSAKSELEVKLNEMTAEKTKADRISKLVDGGYDRDDATAKVEKFAGISDEAFDVLAAELTEAKKYMSDKDKKKEDKKDDMVEAADLENAEPQDTDTTVADSTDNSDKTAETEHQEFMSALAQKIARQLSRDGDK